MASVLDVAKYILHRNGKMTTWGLQKLCYYSQAWCLAWTGKEMFPEEFEAWRNGPVCRELYNAHKGLYTISESSILAGDMSHLSDEHKRIIDIVLRDYGDMQPYELREQTHSELPWIIARNGIPESENCDSIIEKSVIGDYYGSL